MGKRKKTDMSKGLPKAIKIMYEHNMTEAEIGQVVDIIAKETIDHLFLRKRKAKT